MQRTNGHPIFAIKDETGQHPIPSAWRPTLEAICSAFVNGDYLLKKTVSSVAPIDAAVADQIKMVLSQTRIKPKESSFLPFDY